LGAVVNNLLIMQGVPVGWKVVDSTSVKALKLSNVWNVDESPPVPMN
jgi:hypothetical protein